MRAGGAGGGGRVRAGRPAAGHQLEGDFESNWNPTYV